MFQNITIQAIQDKTTTTQKPYKACVVKDESGADFKVNIWSDFPDFANLKVGSVIRAKLEQKGQYWNIISETQGKPRGGGFSAHKEAVIEKAVERKESFIEKSQDNKEWGMKVSATWRDAVILATTEFKDKTVLDGLDEAVLKWRRFCWDNFDVELKDTDALTGKLTK